MGLDISYYKLGNKVEVDDNIEPYSDEWYDKYGGDLLRLYDSGWDQSDGLEDGYYEGEYIDGFRAGSYSGYSWFRDTLKSLAEMAYKENKELQERYEGGYEAFESLIYFSDCEGYLGPFTSTDLFNAFRDFEKPIIQDIIKMAKYGVRRELYDRFKKEDLDWFVEKYRDWKTAFEKTKGEGIVLFH